MAVLIEGLQGSGKSYYATYKMLHDADKYSKIFTNIDGIRNTDKILDLEFKKFTNEILAECYRIQVVEDGDFQSSINFLQKMHILPQGVSRQNRILMVIDEAQNYFGKSVKLDPSLVWFITQHRHLYIELYLITQKYTLLRPDYHLFNVIYKAYPPIKQFSKSKIRYREYAGLPMSDENLSKKFTLPKEKEVFQMYISGDKVDSPSVLKKFIGYILFIILFIVGMFYLFLNQFGEDSTPINPIEKIEVNPSLSTQKTTLNNTQMDSSENALYTIVVSGNYFYIREDEDRADYPIKMLAYLQQHYFQTVIEKVNSGYGLTILYVICKREMLSI